MLRLSITKWMVFASGYADAKVTATWANSKPERSGVAKVKCRPAFGSTAQKTLAVPHPLYFVILACFPSWHRRRAWPHIGVQSDRFLIQTNYRLFGVIGPLVDLQDVFHLGDVVVIEVGHYPHFFP